MTPTNELPPIADPVLTITGRTFTVAYDLTAQFKLSQWGVDPRRFACLLVADSPDPHASYYAMQCWAACVASNYVGEIAPTGEEWARKLSAAGITDDSPEWRALCKATGTALGKRLRATAKRQPQPQTATATAEASLTAVN